VRPDRQRVLEQLELTIVERHTGLALLDGKRDRAGDAPATELDLDLVARVSRRNRRDAGIGIELLDVMPPNFVMRRIRRIDPVRQRSVRRWRLRLATLVDRPRSAPIELDRFQARRRCKRSRHAATYRPRARKVASPLTARFHGGPHVTSSPSVGPRAAN